jgi:hypothetical protein
MKKSLLFKSILIAASVPLFTGCVTREVVYRDRPAREVVVAEAPAPPPLREEIITVAPAPGPLWVWVPGCWEWRGRWVWSDGHWGHRPRVNAVWVAPHWEHRAHGHVWIGGGWR